MVLFIIFIIYFSTRFSTGIGFNLFDMIVIWVIAIMLYVYKVCKDEENNNKKGGDK